VFIPLQEIYNDKKHFNVATTELFGPFQVITEYKDNEADKVHSYVIFPNRSLQFASEWNST